MHADVVVNHEFETCQADTGIRQLTEAEMPKCGLPTFIMIFVPMAGNSPRKTSDTSGFQNAVVDFAFVAFGARYGDERTVF